MHDGDIAARIAADQTGYYALDAAAGDYTLVVDVGGPFPTCPATPVKLTAAITVTVNVACDTGIR
jgi:hypothetical protein